MPDADCGFRTDGAGHAGMFGPTTGDRVRLGDTDLVLAVERDVTVTGDEVKFGGGKVIRDGMGQDPRATRAAGSPDLVITNALIVDHTGIYKADIGVRDGLICGIGKAGNPGLQVFLLGTVRQWSQVAVRTVPVGQSDAVAVVGALLEEVTGLARRIARQPRMLASAAPGWDAAVLGHGELTARYFRS